MDWRRIECWWSGHDVRQDTAIMVEDKKYHGHTTTRTFGKCVRCGEGTLENELSCWTDEKSFWVRNDWIVPTIIGTAIVVALFALCIVPPLYFANKGCLDAGVQMDLESKYSMWSGCFYKVDGRWIADELLSVVELLK